jgi:flagellar assembly protein FliH
MSKIIDKEASGEYQRWQLPLVEDVSAAVANAKKDKASGLLTAEQIERIQAQAYKEAYDEGFQQGRQAGLSAGQAEMQRKAALLETLLASLQEPFQELDAEVEQELLQLAFAVARQLVRRELKSDPGQVVAVVQEALAALPVATRNVRVHLHPEDVSMVSETLSGSDGERHWKLVEDPTLNRGDCRVLSENSQVDATLERRLAAVVTQLMGGEREQDAGAEREGRE